MTNKPDQQDMNQEQLEQCISTLTDVASEIRSENHAGWGNAIDDVIESLKGRRLVQAGDLAGVIRLIEAYADGPHTEGYYGERRKEMLKALEALVSPTEALQEHRLMQCPFCGHQKLTSSIGAVHCGPHKLDDGTVSPAVRMTEALQPASPDKEVK